MSRHSNKEMKPHCNTLATRAGSSSSHPEGTVGERFDARLGAEVARNRFGPHRAVARIMPEKFDVS